MRDPLILTTPKNWVSSLSLPLKGSLVIFVFVFVFVFLFIMVRVRILTFVVVVGQVEEEGSCLLVKLLCVVYAKVLLCCNSMT